MVEEREVTFRVFRYNPKKDAVPHWEEYRIRVTRDMSVLDSLLKIKEELDPTLALRYSCRQAICGSCGLTINGKPRLACYTRVFELDSDVIEVAPLKNVKVIKDLVTDFTPLFEKEKGIYPYLIRKDLDEVNEPTGFYKQPERDLLEYLEFANCIECGLCYAACPVVATDPLYLGPFILNRVYRLCTDSRDQGADVRLEVVDSDHGCWRCHFAAACSDVCPKGVDPAKAIQFLKRIVIKRHVLKSKVPERTVEIVPIPHAKQEVELPREEDENETGKDKGGG